MMKNRLILLLVALVWGTTFIFQRISTGTMGTFSIIGLRFILGAAAILPLVFLQKKRNNTAAQQPADAKKTHAAAEIPDAPETKETPWPLWLCGC
ncbi:MAG: DMT family transporter, partial [Acidaminococcaceae bacterium]|nr:DMT family transporter [Acidaminococcaceae bacterium]